MRYPLDLDPRSRGASAFPSARGPLGSLVAPTLRLPFSRDESHPQGKLLRDRALGQNPNFPHPLLRRLYLSPLVDLLDQSTRTWDDHPHATRRESAVGGGDAWN